MPDLPDDTAGGLSRRAVLGLGIVAVAAGASASACSVDTPITRRRATGPAPLSHDVGVATAALAAVRVARGGVAATSARFPALRASLAGLVALHQEHERALVDAVPARARASATATPYAVPRRRPAAVSQLAAAEQLLHATLDTLALTAQSGEFARLLAGMGAAVSQRLTELSA